MKLKTLSSLLLATLLATAAAGCSGDSDGGSNEPKGGNSDADYADGATFTFGMSSDPGNLDPLMGAGTSLFTVTKFAYDSLVNVDGETGEVQPALASTWDVEGTTATFTLNEGITCANGADLTATDVANSLNFVTDEKNQSPFLGTFIPAGATAAADDASRTVTLTLAEPAPFILNGLGYLPIVCAEGTADRSMLAAGTDGTGPYELTEAAPGDHYTYTVRKGYTWGPAGATTDEKGLPAKVVIQVVENETTAANLLQSGGLNGAEIAGPDAERLEKAGLFSASSPALIGEQWYNHAEGRVTSDPAVRMALTQALDLDELAKVITSGRGGPATTLAVSAPVPCPGDSVSGSLPESDPEAAEAALDAAGWAKGSDGVRAKDGQPLSLTFLYQNNIGAAGDAAAELVVEEWKSIGVDATAKSQGENALTGVIFGSGDWDVAWISLNVSSPDQLVPFLSGPTPPDGTNFSAIADDTYDSAVQAASKMNGTDGCDAWLAAESGLVANADVVPFANTDLSTFGNGAEFEAQGQLMPLSIRMLAK
jgi:peptide/nickel transport system substrate-binding protein